MSNDLFSSGYQTDNMSSYDNHEMTNGSHDADEIEIDHNALEIPVTENDIQIREKINHLKIVDRCVSALLFFWIIGFFAGWIGLRHYLKISTNQFFILFVLYFVILAILIAFVVIISKKMNRAFKEEFVGPILMELLHYDMNASKYFRENVPFKSLFNFLKLDSTWNCMEISDCILGEVEFTKFAFVDFELYHTANKRRAVDYKGQLLYIPANQTVPLEFQNRYLNENKLRLTLQTVFGNAFMQNNSTIQYSMDQNTSDFYNQYTSYSNNQYSNYSKQYSSLSKHHDSSSSSEDRILLEEAKVILGAWGPCDFYCTEHQIIVILKNEKDPFEIQPLDEDNEIVEVKRRVLDETKWVKFIISTIKRTGLV